jgi:hypothetical protein
MFYIRRAQAIFCALLHFVVAALGLYASWGRIGVPNETDYTAVFQYKYHTEAYSFKYGSSANYMLDVCMKKMDQFNRSSEQCEEFVDEAFFHWFHMFYAPGMYSSVDLDVTNYMVSRGVILSMVSEKYGHQTYLEIGTDRDDIFSEARKRFKVAVGVDPLSGGTLRMTSNEFFTTNTQYFDMIFVDGLHEANQVYADVMNALRWLSPGGTVLMHDCNPHGILSNRAAYPLPPNVRYWNGDTWKAVVALRLLDYIDIVVVDADHGVAVIRKRPNSEPLTEEWKAFLGSDPIGVLSDSILRTHRQNIIPLVTVFELDYWLDQPGSS